VSPTSNQPRRSIPPVIDDPRAANLTLAQRHTLLLLPVALDDRGRALDDTGRINGLLWGPLWREHGPDDLDADLRALAEAGYLTRYSVDGVNYLQMADWVTHQVISRPAASQYPAPPAPEGAGAGGFGSWRHGAAGEPGKPGGEKWEAAGERVRASVDELVDMVAGAGDKLRDPAVQNRAVSFIADLAGQVDPSLKEKVQKRAHKWIGTPGEHDPSDVTVTTTVTSPPPPAPRSADEPPAPPVPPVPPVPPAQTGEPRTQQPPAQPWTQQPETPRSQSGTDSE
jgi:hypothetical protein